MWVSKRAWINLQDDLASLRRTQAHMLDDISRLTDRLVRVDKLLDTRQFDDTANRLEQASRMARRGDLSGLRTLLEDLKNE